MIVVKNVSKTLGGRKVVNDISFHIAPFEGTGIIGKNGAGKTTLLNIMSGILKADCGFIRISGCKDTLKDYGTLRKLVYVSGTKSQLWSDMKLIYSFDNCGKMYGMGKRDFKERLGMLTDIFDIEDCLYKPVNQLSLGQKVRGELVYALLPEPEILFLDEAMIGLDVSVRERIMSVLNELKESMKATIIYTSHNLVEVERLCDRIILIDNGMKIFDGSVESIMRGYAPEYKIDFEIQGEFPDMEDLPVEKYVMDNNILSIKFQKQKVETVAIIRHITDRCRINNIKLTEPNLEDTVKKIYERKGQI